MWGFLELRRSSKIRERQTIVTFLFQETRGPGLDVPMQTRFILVDAMLQMIWPRVH